VRRGKGSARPPRGGGRPPPLRWLGVGGIALAILALWYAAVAAVHHVFSPVIATAFPYPAEIAIAYRTYLDTFAGATAQTALWAVVGFLAGSGSGFVIGLAMSQSRLFERALMPYLVILQMVPLFAFIPVVFAATHSLDLTRLVVAGMLTVFVVTVGVLQGAKSADAELGDVFAIYDASRWATLRKGLIPMMSPYLFGVARNAAPLSITGALVVDIIGGSSGLGYLMISGMTFGHSQVLLLWGALFITMALAGALALAVGQVERLVARWEPGR
jgi:NitT/TauT family transport system permease protein